MKKTVLSIAAVLVIGLFFHATTLADEGMWLLTQIDKLLFSEMKKYGLELTPEQIFNPNGNGLSEAIITFGGGTGSFISADGLILTNHHVAYGAIQSISSANEDYLKNGFYAKNKGEEISIPSYTARVVIKIRDVTNEVISAVTDTMSAESRVKAIQGKSREIEKTEKGETDNECAVSETYNGLRYYLYTFKIFRDIRLVYAPPSSIGNYGGEIDNWIWPRHTGDFSLMRAYVAPDGKPSKYSKDNVSYKPNVYLKISSKGYEEGNFAMILGYPGRTFRYQTRPEIHLAKEETLPFTIDLFKTRMTVIEKAGKNDRAVEIKYASKWRGMANTFKKSQGVLEGMRRSDLLNLKQDQDAKMEAFIHSNSELAGKYGAVLSAITEIIGEQKNINKKQIMMNQMLSGIDILRIAARIKEYTQGDKSEKSTSDLKEQIKTILKNVDLSVDKELFAVLLDKAAELPANQQINAVTKIFGNKTGEKREHEIRDFVKELYEETRITTQEGCEKLITKPLDKIMDDEFIDFYTRIDNENAVIRSQASQINARLALNRKRLLEVWTVFKDTNIYPDANGTLRLTYGRVKSFNPRDAVHYNYMTTLSGVIEKETGEDPFIVPAKLHQLWEKKDFGGYAVPNLNDIPVAFLTDLDITGGNSGSPVINGKGEIIGLAFDGNWESVVNDYLFQDPLDRTISVDARYIVFILDKFSDAQNLLKELEIR